MSFGAWIPNGQYIRAAGLVLYPYVFVAGPNKHDTLLVFSLAQKLQQGSLHRDLGIALNKFFPDSIAIGLLML